MNTDVGVWLWSTRPDAKAVLGTAPAFVEAVEQELSRFRPDSGLSRLNAAAGKGPQAVSETLLAVCKLALQMAQATDGLFDPTVLPALAAAGYDVSFERISAQGTGVGPAARPAGRTRTAPRWREIATGTNTITLPAGAALDLGGLAKGWTVDRLAERLKALGPVMVDAGGDIHAYGQVQGKAWPVAVAHPFGGKGELAVVDLDDEAIVTSSIGKRRWQRDGRWLHHIIDPRTQESADTDLHTVTVLGPSAVTSEVSAKVAIMLGSDAGERFLASRGLSALLVMQDGSVRAVGDRASFSQISPK